MTRRYFAIGSALLATGAAFYRFAQADEKRPTTGGNYTPQVHYAPPTGFMNDPNGLVFFDGEYHLYYQHNPSAATMGNVHWGHAVSPDLLNWQTLPTALFNTPAGQAFSGSAVVDQHNLSGLFQAQPDAGEQAGGIVAIYTRASATLQTQEIAASSDRGRSFVEYAHNPVLDIGSSQFRDPKVFWHAPEQCWIMVVVEARSHRVLFYGSVDLKSWDKRGEFADSGLLGIDYECPDLIRVPVENGGERWVLILSINPGGPLGGSAVQYFIGDFDGRQFTAEDRVTRLMDFGKDFYAFQSFSNHSGAPVGLAWLSNWQYANEVPASPSRGMMTLPRTLGLRRVGKDWRLVQQFVDLAPLAGKLLIDDTRPWGSATLATAALPAGEAIEVRLEVELQPGAVVTVRLSNQAGETLEAGFDAGPFGGLFIDRHGASGFEQRYFVDRFSYAFQPDTRTMDMHLVIDRSCLELLGAAGSAAGTALYYTKSPLERISVVAQGGNARLSKVFVTTLTSIPSAQAQPL